MRNHFQKNNQSKMIWHGLSSKTPDCKCEALSSNVSPTTQPLPPKNPHRPDGYSCNELILDSYVLFYSSCFHVCFYASSMFFCYLGSLYNLKLGIVMPPALLFLLKIDIQCLLCFHTNSRVNFSIFVKNDIRILMKIALKL
jgi:hypothetical protein